MTAEGLPLDAAGAPVPRSLLRIAVDPVFGPFFVGKLLANVGIWIFNIATVILVFDSTGSPLLVGLVSVMLFAPQVLLVTVSGAVADRANRKLQLLAGRLLCTAGTLTIWLLLWVGGESPPTWAVMAAVATVGVGFTVGGPAMQAMLPSLVRARETPKAVALDNFSFAIGRAFGPAVGGVMAVTVGLTWAFAVSTVLHVVFGVVVATLPSGDHPRGASDDTSIRAGLAYVARRPAIAAVLLGVTAIGIGADPAITLAPSLASQVGGGADLVGTFASAFGLGAFVAFFPQSLLTRRLGSERLASIGLLCLAAGAVVLIGATATWLAVLAFGLAGVGMTLALTALGTELYARVPSAFRGRVMALWLLGFMGSRPLAAGLNGVLADVLSVGSALAVTAVLVLGAAWACRPAVLREPSDGAEPGAAGSAAA